MGKKIFMLIMISMISGCAHGKVTHTFNYEKSDGTISSSPVSKTEVIKIFTYFSSSMLYCEAMAVGKDGSDPDIVNCLWANQLEGSGQASDNLVKITDGVAGKIIDGLRAYLGVMF